MNTLIYTKENEWLKRWDNYVSLHPKGSHLMFSSWLKSYESYGFDYEIGLSLSNDKIIGGYAVVIPKILNFKFYILPHSPIYNLSSQLKLEDYLLQIKGRAKEVRSCYLQISLPISSNEKVVDHVYHECIRSSIEKHFKKGKQFSHIYASYGLNWVDLRSFSNRDLFLSSLTPKVRRNVRIPKNKGAKARFVDDINLIAEGYKVIVANAKQSNYNVRSFDDFKNTIIELVSSGRGYFMIIEVNDEIKAAGFFTYCSGYITNIMGGVLREKPDIKLGYLLQWEMIKKSYDLDLKGYNISIGGSVGVQEFKSKFRAESIYFDQPHYHLILKPMYFKLFMFLNRYISPYKAQISKLLKFFKNEKSN